MVSHKPWQDGFDDPASTSRYGELTFIAKRINIYSGGNEGLRIDFNINSTENNRANGEVSVYNDGDNLYSLNAFSGRSYSSGSKDPILEGSYGTLNVNY